MKKESDWKIHGNPQVKRWWCLWVKRGAWMKKRIVESTQRCSGSCFWSVTWSCKFRDKLELSFLFLAVTCFQYLHDLHLLYQFYSEGRCPPVWRQRNKLWYRITAPRVFKDYPSHNPDASQTRVCYYASNGNSFVSVLCAEKFSERPQMVKPNLVNITYLQTHYCVLKKVWYFFFCFRHYWSWLLTVLRWPWTPAGEML